MGFYGNITNVSRTQFQFDKIYSNRKAMEQAKITDGIYLGRYVLVEYDDAGLDGMKQVYIKDNKFYTAPSYDDSTRLNNNNTVENEVVYYIHPSEGYLFYKRTSTENNGEAAEFSQITNGSETAYVRNFNIDKEAYGAGRGYDSTVWQKVYSDEQERYVMIAELNTVVPTFAIAADAPTMTPVTPHFDTQSTDVYYKLHMQNPWIVRVAEAKNGAPSDTTIKWQEVVKDESKEVGKQYEIVTTEKNGAIYFNKAAFDSQVGESTIVKKADGENKITIDLVSSGLELYDDHDNTTDKPISANDIQEMTIHLPGIGNMMSDAWDIIHGSNRDNARTDVNSSLQGRLDSFNAFYENQIPVKRASDGTIVGSKINGANNYDKNIDLLTLPDGANGTVDGPSGDDAWIETNINSSFLKSGDKGSDNDQINNSGISIHHTFHKTENSSSTVDKNTGITTFEGEYKENHIRSTNKDHKTDDVIDLYVPYVDAKGHVVGHNIETVTLPYGYKIIKTNGRSTEISENATGTPVTTDIVAGNTQDTLTINSGNKWIRIDTDVDNDTITIRHDVHDTSDTEDTTDWTETEANTTIPTVIYEYDKAGHYLSHHTENYKLPFGYGKIKGDSGTTAATATYDALTFASDEWLTATVTEDKVTYNHDEPNPNEIVYTDKEDQYPSFGSTFTIEDWAFDEKGHQFNNNKSHTVTIPDVVLNNANDGNVVVGLSLSKATKNNDKTATFTESKVNVGNLALTDYSVVRHTNANGSTDVQPQDTINSAFNKLQTQIYEEEVARADETSRAQEAEKALNDRIDALDYSENVNNTNIITQITQVDGKITNVARAAAGTLVLGTASSEGMVSATDSLSTAFNAAEKKINDEINRANGKETELNTAIGNEKNRAEAAEKALGERIDTLIGGDNLNTAFDTLQEVSEWLAANDSGADKVIDDIATLNGDSDAEGSVDYKIKTQVLDELGSAAYTESSAYATAAQGEKADSAVQSTTTFTYSGEQKTIAELFSIVAELSATVVELQNELNTLKEKVEKEHPTPIEPETPTEPENPETNE